MNFLAATVTQVFFVSLLMQATPQDLEHLKAPPPANPIVPTTPEFTEASKNFRDMLKRLVDLELRFHDSDTPEDQAHFKKQWHEEREKAVVLHRAMLHAGLAEFSASPQNNFELGDFLFETLSRNVKSDMFEGMLPIAKTLYDAKYPAAELLGMYVMCCLAENEFDAAREPLSTLLQNGQSPPELVAIYNRLDGLKAAWQEEQELRAQDAAGEPLPHAKVVTTKGTFVIELFENQAPQAVANFISLAEKGFYNYNQFFLVLTNEIAQTGCPNADGRGNPGYFIPHEADDLPRRHVFRGSVALARLPNLPDSGGSQFIISYLPTVEIESQATVFGRVVSGMPNIASLARIDPNAKKKEGEPPVVTDEILSIEITDKRNHPYEPQRLANPGQ